MSEAPVTEWFEQKDSAHVVQFYTDDVVLMDGSARFLGAALGAGDAAVIIATRTHRDGIAERLKAAGIDTVQASRQSRYVALDAEETLAKFMVKGSPGAKLFEQVIGPAIDQARAATSRPEDARVSAFGEMVAILWAEGNHRAALQLEKLWNRLAETRSFSLRCAYPMPRFDRGEHSEPFLQICAEHEGVIPTEAYTDLTNEGERLRTISQLQQKAQVLEAEIALRKAAQAALERSHAELEALVQQRTAALRELSMRLLHAQDEERRRISRELHDSIGQSIAAAKMSVAELTRRSTARTTEAFAQLDEMLETCLQETRTLSYLLHPPILDEVGFFSAAKWYIDGFADRSGMRVNLEVPPQPERLGLPLETALFRILQESLTNVHRHAKSATVDIRLALTPTDAVVEVRDYGQGIAAEVLERFQSNGTGSGLGLAGIRERVCELGGHLEIEPASPGTRVRARVPILHETVR
ncbi:MAG: ATP-binding protein [Candidatus Acidiferrales bacterium]